RRRHTRFSRDWSSDVCSSDLSSGCCLRKTKQDYPSYFRKQHPELAERVFFEGYVSEERLAQCYADADVLIAPSVYESFGLVYLRSEERRVGRERRSRVATDRT